MKNLKIKIMSAFIAVALVFGVGFAPVLAGAETVEETPVENTETVETPENTDDTTTDEETPETEENGAETGDNDSEESPSAGEEKESEITLEDLLAFVGELAEENGLADEWNGTIEQLKLALEEEKISATLIVNILVLVAIVGYLVFKGFGKIVAWIKRKRNPSTVSEDLQAVQKTSVAQTEAVNKQTKAINALAETDEHVVETVEKENAKINALAQAQIGTNAAIRCLIRGTGIKAEIKDEAFRALNNSDEQCDIAKK